jgi:hypothetical protein
LGKLKCLIERFQPFSCYFQIQLFIYPLNSPLIGTLCFLQFCDSYYSYLTHLFSLLAKLKTFSPLFCLQKFNLTLAFSLAVRFLKNNSLNINCILQFRRHLLIHAKILPFLLNKTSKLFLHLGHSF